MSPTYLFLTLSFFCQTILASRSQVSWISPASGDVYTTGETIVGAWKSQAGVNSPSFKLCHDYLDGSDSSNANESYCGGTVWPNVEKNGTTSFASLAVPNMTLAGSFRLLMKDDMGDTFHSPAFSLSPNRSITQLQPPLLSASILASSTSSSTIQSATQSTIPQLNNKAPPAAIAIPLSLCGALVVTALLFLLRRKRNTVSQGPQFIPPPIPISLSLPTCPSNSKAQLLEQNHKQYAVPAQPQPAIYPSRGEPDFIYFDGRQEREQRQYDRERELEREWRDEEEKRYTSRSSMLGGRIRDSPLPPDWDEWVLNREMSIKRRQEELHRTRERGMMKQRRKLERQMELHNWERNERDRYRRADSRGSSGKTFDRWPSHHSSFFRYESSRGSSSPTRVGSIPPSFKHWNEPSVTADVMDRYTAPSHRSLSRQSVYTTSTSRSRSRSKSHFSHSDDTTANGSDVHRPQPPRDVYSAVERAIGGRRARSPGYQRNL